MSIHELLQSSLRAFIYSTGAGAGATKQLWDIPGCSSYLVGTGFPYDPKQTSKVIGYTPKQFCSMETAAELAMAAYMEAYDPNNKDQSINNVGIGLSGSVASTVEHKGDHRLYIVAVTDNRVITAYVKLRKGSGEVQRQKDGDVSDYLITDMLEESANLNGLTKFEMNYIGSTMVEEFVKEDNEKLVKDLLLARPFFHADGTKSSAKDYFGETHNYNEYIFYPGSFNPYHDGHAQGSLAAFKTAVHLNDNVKGLVHTTCINPKHKAEPTVPELLRRIKQMRSKNFLLTLDDPYYVDKAKMFPGSMIAMGADVLLSLFDPKWGLDPVEMLDVFADNNVRFLVQGRLVGDKFYKLQEIRELIKVIKPDGKTYYPLQDTKYYRCFAHVEGRLDLSSTELRNK